MNPLQPFGILQLLWPQGIADEDIRVRQFFLQPRIVRQLHYAHLWPPRANGSGHAGFRPPFGERVPYANGQFCVFRSRAIHEFRTRFSDFFRSHRMQENSSTVIPSGARDLLLAGNAAQSQVFARTRRSRPVMSEGEGSPRIRNSVGAMSRSAPPGARLSPSFSETQMSGTGFVV